MGKRDYAGLTMMTSLLVSVALLVSALLPANAASGETMLFESGLSGLPSQIEGNMVRDSDGFLWFCYYGGIARYDGYEIKYFHAGPGSVSGAATMSIHADNNHKIWIATKDNGVNIYDKNTGSFTYLKHDPANPNSLASNSSESFSANRLFIDSEGFVLIGTDSGLDIYAPETDTFTHFKNNPENPNSLSSNNVTAVIRGKDGIIWVGTAGGGLNSFDPESGQWQRYSHVTEDPSSLSSNMVWSLLEDSEGTLWVGTLDNGLNSLDRDAAMFTRYLSDPQDPGSISDNKVIFLFEDSSKNIWVAHRDSKNAGLDKFDKASGRFIAFAHDPQDSTTPSSNAVSAVYEDPINNIFWVLNTYAGKFDKFDPNTKKFTFYQHDPADPRTIYSSQVVVMLEDSQGRFWVSTKGSLDLLDRDTGFFTHFPYDSIDSRLGSAIIAFHEDEEGYLWLLDYGKLGSLIKLDPETMRVVKMYSHDPKVPDSFLPNTMPGEALIGDKDDPDILWIGTSSGLVKFNKRSEKFTHFVHDPADPDSITQGTVWTLWDDGEGTIWVSTFGGLNRLDKKTQIFTRYQHDPQNPQSIGFNKNSSVFLDSYGNFWVAGFTDGFDRFDRETDQFKHFNRRNDFPGTGVNHTIQEDGKGNLWIGTTDAGLVKFDIQQERVEKVYTKSDGLHGNYLWRSYKTRDGTIFFSGPAGLSSFRPSEVQDNQLAPPVYLTALRQAGQKMHSDIEPEYVQEIELDWKSNFFEFQFAALNYSNPENNQYAYKLEGRDQDWFYSGPTPWGRYTGLKGGHYLLRLKGSNNDGVWNEAETSLKIVVVPPFWQTNWFALLFSGGFLAIGSIALFYTAWLRREIAKRERAEAALRLEEENLRITLDSIGDGVIATDMHGKVQRMNPMAEKLTGWNLEEGKNQELKNVFNIVHAETKKPVTSPVEKVLESKEVVGLADHTLLRSKDNNEYRIADSGAPIRSPDGTLTGVVLVFRDITEEHAMLMHLQHSQKMDAIGHLAGGVAHDFNNLLNGIIGAADLIKIRIQGDEKSRKYHQIIMEAAHRAAGLTQKLLTFSRKQHPVSSVIHLHQVIENTVVILSNTIDKRIKIDLDLHAESDKVIGDPSLLQSVFLNLGINASHAMPEGGRLLIQSDLTNMTSEKLEKTGINLQPGVYLQVKVQDNGIGIQQEYLERIFDPFFTTKEKGKGTGLGLATVFGSMQQHGGVVEVESEEGVGTLFTILLPLTQRATTLSATGHKPISGTGRILVIDDEAINRATAQELLEGMGYDVILAEDGKKGLDSYMQEGETIDLVLLDMIMPEMNGRDCFNRLKELNPKVLVVITSGFADTEDLAAMRESGVSGFLAKPYGQVDLSRTLHKVLTDSR